MDQIRFSIGDYTEGDGRLPVQVRIRPGVDSGSFLVTGMPGSGKSVCGQWLLYQLAKQGVPVIALDLHSTLTQGQIFPAFQGMFARRAKRHNLYTANLPCPLFQPMQFPDGTAETVYDTAAAIAGTLSSHFRFGQKQRSILTDACEQVIQSGSYGQMGIAALEGALQNSSSKGAQEVASRLRSLLLHNPFVDGQEPVAEPYIHIIDLTKYAGDPPTQSSIAELLLFYIWKRISSSEVKRPLFIYCDEFQNVGLRRNGTLWKMITEGRKFGLNVILITQSLSAQFSAEEQQLLLQIPYLLTFRTAGRDTNCRARHLSSVENQREMVRLLNELNRGSCIFSGPAYLGEDTQSILEPILVNIQAGRRIVDIPHRITIRNGPQNSSGTVGRSSTPS